VIGWAGTWRIAFEQSDPGAVLRDGWTEGAIFAAVVLLGEVVRTRRALLEEARLRAAAQEQAREREIRERVAAERLGIARELHDVLAHTLSVVAVQAGVALDGDGDGDGRQEETRTAPQAIRSASRSAMAELRATVAVLRTGAGESDRAVATRLPTPTLDQLDDLVGAAAQAGLDVDVDVDPAVEDLPPMVGVTAFRIVQESLTNVIRHAQSRRVTVPVLRGSDELLVQVRDDGRGRHQDATTHPKEGFGITGMVERATAIGGTVEVGPAAPHGFQVTARLPVRA
jgi:signal transduction histidine kinase